jgi:hypothetical protein
LACHRLTAPNNFEMNKLLLILVLVVAFVLSVVAICFFGPRRAVVELPGSTSCEIRINGLYQRFTDQQFPLVCTRDGREIGRVEFAFGIEWFRTAIFPGRGKHDLICFNEDDQTIALFVIDLEQDSGPDRSVPKGFFIPGSPIIKSTCFAFRRCSAEDVAYLKRYIESADIVTWHNSWVGTLPYLSNPTKQWVLTKIEHVTTPDRVPLAGEIPKVMP